MSDFLYSPDELLSNMRDAIASEDLPMEGAGIHPAVRSIRNIWFNIDKWCKAGNPPREWQHASWERMEGVGMARIEELEAEGARLKAEHDELRALGVMTQRADMLRATSNRPPIGKVTPTNQ